MDIKEAKKLILGVEARSSTELIKHQHGPGTRFVFSDEKNNPEGNIYVIVRFVENVDRPEAHVAPHSHDYESMNIFKGNNPDMSGLECEMFLDGKWYPITAPQAVRIPPHMEHTYRLVSGSGEYWNIVLTPGANYNQTIH
jgi:2-isopropylmalate synthase